MLLETISAIARNFVILGLAVALVLMFRVAVRSKTIRSLQAELSIFLTIWILSELVRDLGILDIIGANPTLAITFHTLAMIAFGFFLLFRFYRASPMSR